MTTFQARAGVTLVVVAATVITVVRVWRDAATTADEPSVDQDVVHDGEPHTLSIAGDHAIRPFVEDQIDAHDPAASRNNGKGLCSIRSTEPHTRPLSILRRRRRRIVGAAADEVERVGTGGRPRHDVETRGAGTAVPTVAVVEAERDGRRQSPKPFDLGASSRAIRRKPVLVEEKTKPSVPGIRGSIRVTIVRQPHTRQPR